jgi:CheY-like chemotaxis protein
VTSELGKGTEFRFQIQVQRGQAVIAETNLPKRALSLAANQPIYKILVVDDKPVNCKLLVRLLAPMGFEVREAHDGQEAIAIWEAWEPHLIWMDMRMPVMDGYEATKYIKSTTKGSATAIIALTASVLEEEKAIVLSSGCDDFIRKPFKEQTIFDTLAKHLGVTYIYDQSHEQSTIQSSNEPILTPEALASYCQEMPTSWKRNLYLASLEADRSRFMDLLAELPNPDSIVGRSLTKLARNFQFEKLIDLLEPIND